MKADGFDWDDGNWPKCAAHGLARHEIEDVFKHEPMVLPDRGSHDEARYNAVGRSAEGRHVFVVFTMRRKAGVLLIRPISARRMHRKEIETYERTKEA